MSTTMKPTKGVRWAEETNKSGTLGKLDGRNGGGGGGGVTGIMRRNNSEDDILHSTAKTSETSVAATAVSPSGSGSDEEGSANRLRGYLEVKHNQTNGKGRSRLLRKVSELCDQVPGRCTLTLGRWTKPSLNGLSTSK
jgi:hypothetical protein